MELIRSRRLYLLPLLLSLLRWYGIVWYGMILNKSIVIFVVGNAIVYYFIDDNDVTVVVIALL